MPKIDWILLPGESIPKQVLMLLENNFSGKDIEKITKFGGKIQLSLTAPYTDRKDQNKSLVINESFILNLKKDPSKGFDILQHLTKNQLINVAKHLNFPITKKSTTKEILKSLIDFLNSEINWQKISAS